MEKNRIAYIGKADFDAYLFHEGTHYKSYEFLGAHPVTIKGHQYLNFTVWAPNAKRINLIGDFNDWNEESLLMKRIEKTGLWNICVEGVEQYDAYKYRIVTEDNTVKRKADPYAFHAETRPHSASKYYNLDGFKWTDDDWIASKEKESIHSRPLSIYEVNLMSWRKHEDDSPYSYRQLTKTLIPYVKKMKYTHIELMPMMEHPFDGSWGYQLTGYFAPSSRYGTPKDFMFFVNECHRNDIGVILDWVPVHFCKDDFGLAKFDGSYLFESANDYKRENVLWGTLNFDFEQKEVRSFLISNAMYWHDYYHIDGFRIDAVSNLLYFQDSDDENQAAIEFIKELNTVVFDRFPNTLMIAEESTSYPLVSAPVDVGGLGFNYKWNMGWMNDILKYMETDPLFRKEHQQALTFQLTYAFSENYILPLSHDEVVHGKKSLLDKMPGTYEEKFANLRLLFMYMMAQPGKKLLFMGGEFGQFIEWNEWQTLDWFLLDYDNHAKTQQFVKELNQFYRNEPCLYEVDHSFSGFEWVEHENHDESILIFERIDHHNERLICIFNFTPVVRKSYPIGVGAQGKYKTLLTSDHRRFGGDTPRIRTYKTKDKKHHNRDYSIDVDLPSLGGLYLKLIH